MRELPVLLCRKQEAHARCLLVPVVQLAHCCEETLMRFLMMILPERCWHSSAAVLGRGEPCILIEFTEGGGNGL